jgi:hypothetical protein
MQNNALESRQNDLAGIVPPELIESVHMNTKERKEHSKMILTMLDTIDAARPIDPLAQSPAGSEMRIVFLDADQIRARKVVTRARFRSTGKYPSWKMGRMLQWESIHERNAFRLLDADPDVKSFDEQPCKIEYVHDGKLKKHTPDILIEFMSGVKEFWEVKTSQEATKSEIASRTTFLAKSLPYFGYRYRVVLAEDLEVQPRLRNTITLLRHGFHASKELERERIRRAFKKHDRLLWSAAVDGQYGPRGLQVLCRLVLESAVMVDMNSLLAPDTCFVVGNGGL